MAPKKKVGDKLYYVHDVTKSSLGSRMLLGSPIDGDIYAVTIKSVGRSYYTIKESSRVRIRMDTLKTNAEQVDSVQLYENVDELKSIREKDSLSHWLHAFLQKQNAQTLNKNYSYDELTELKRILTK